MSAVCGTPLGRGGDPIVDVGDLGICVEHGVDGVGGGTIIDTVFVFLVTGLVVFDDDDEDGGHGRENDDLFDVDVGADDDDGDNASDGDHDREKDDSALWFGSASHGTNTGTDVDADDDDDDDRWRLAVVFLPLRVLRSVGSRVFRFLCNVSAPTRGFDLFLVGRYMDTCFRVDW